MPLHHVRPRRRRPARCALVVAALVASVGLVACGEGGSGGTAENDPTATAAGLPSAASPSLVAPAAADALLGAPPAGLVVLDVRTAEEFAAGHLEGAVMIDFQSPTFADDVIAIDRDVPVLVYCRSGNRSAQAVAAMVGLGFANLIELDGGVVAWEAAGLPLVSG